MLASGGVRAACALCVAWCCAVVVARWCTDCTTPVVDDVVARAAQLGLKAQALPVRTADGYELSVHHLCSTGTGPPVLLVSGLLQGAGAWLDAGTAGLATLLATAGRDVWLANVRGTPHARRHTSLNPSKDPLYWRFSVDEIGRFDLPALIDRVLNATGATSLDYIGFSQGGAAFFIMCSELPRYCSKVNLMIAMAPATRLIGMKSPARMAFELCATVEEELMKRGIWEVLPLGGLIQITSEVLCNLPFLGVSFCEFVKDIYDGPHPGSVEKSTFLAAATNFPSGTSVHNMARYGQHIRSGRFAKYDYGPERNLAVYGNATAPDYDLSAVSTRTVLLYAAADRLVDATNMRWLSRRLPNLEAVHEIEDPLWSHMDFTMSRNIPKHVYPIIEKYLNKYS